MKQFRKAGIKLSFDKCIIKSKLRSFFESTYTAQGMKPDPKRIQVIEQIQEPSTKQELNSFLGMVNYSNQFILAVCDLTFNVRTFLKKDILFNGQIAMRRISRN